MQKCKYRLTGHINKKSGVVLDVEGFEESQPSIVEKHEKVVRTSCCDKIF
jgi:hypothetical protein